MNLPSDRICPVKVASKIVAARNCPDSPFARMLTSRPETRELLYYIQWSSIEPGGLQAFANKVIAIATKEARAIDPAVTFEQWRADYRRIPFEYRPRIKVTAEPSESLKLAVSAKAKILDDIIVAAEELRSLSDPSISRLKDQAADERDDGCRVWAMEGVAEERRRQLLDFGERIRSARRDVESAKARLNASSIGFGDEIRRDPGILMNEIAPGVAEQLMANCPPEQFEAIALKAATTHLPGVLCRFCTEPGFCISDEFGPEDQGAEVWFMPRLLEFLRLAIRQHAEIQLNRIAPTVVQAKIFDALDFGWESQGFVEIRGSSRFGKSEAARAWALSHPGRARYFAVPSEPKAIDLYRSVADALGITYEFSTPAPWLADQVRYVIQWSGLGMIADEAHFLLPTRFSRNTQPQRLDWFRTQLVDRKIPCAIIVTPQVYDRAVKQFARTTGYAMEQWRGRTSFQVILPEELTDHDIESVCRHFFPSLTGNLVEVLIGRAMLAPSFLKAFEDVASRAHYLARIAGRSVTAGDIRAAVDEVLPIAKRDRPREQSVGGRGALDATAAELRRGGGAMADRLQDLGSQRKSDQSDAAKRIGLAAFDRLEVPADQGLAGPTGRLPESILQTSRE